MHSEHLWWSYAPGAIYDDMDEDIINTKTEINFDQTQIIFQ